MLPRALPSPAIVLLARLAGALLAGGALAGCSTLQPFAAVRAELVDASYVEVSGRAIHVERQGAGEPLVLLHGFGASTYLWRAVVPELARRHEVVAIDLNGFGWTERARDPGEYTLAGQSATVLGVLDALGLGRVHLAGHSYGGGLALALADRHPERIRSLILVDNTLPRYGSARRSAIFAFRPLANLVLRCCVLTERRVRAGLRESYFDDAKVTPELVEEYLDRLRVEGVADAFYGLTAPSNEPPIEVDLATITAPTLVVWGENDELIRLADGRAGAGKIPDADFVVLPRCGHSPMEECPEAFLAAVVPFLARLASAGVAGTP